MAGTKRSASGGGAEEPQGFSDDERAAMKERAQELKAAKRRGSRAGQADGEKDLMGKIAEMSESDREIAERLHALITAGLPELSPRTWYGMPAYAIDGTVVCFFQAGQKFKTRYATLGFSDRAKLDDGAMWPTAFAVREWTADVEARIATLLTCAVG